MPVQLGDLRTRAQARGDFENDGNVSTTAWNALINGSRKRLRRLLVMANPQQFAAVTADFTLSGATYTDDLATRAPTFWKVLSLDRSEGSGADDFAPVRRFLWAERNRLTDRRYRVYASTLEIRPASLAAGTYRLWYIEQPALLVADANALTLVEDMWDEFVILDAAIKARKRGDKESDHLEKELAAIVGEIARLAADNDVGEPDRILDVEDDAFPWRPRLPAP